MEDEGTLLDEVGGLVNVLRLNMNHSYVQAWRAA